MFKNTANGAGVYERFPELRAFAERWTAAFGREVDIKLEYWFNAPLYQALPGGPIAVVDSKRAPAAAPGAEAPPAADDKDEDEAGDDVWYGIGLAIVSALGW